jgi:hypothetical protein
MSTAQQNFEIGRVLRADTTGFAFGSRVSQLEAPAFGGLVKALTGNDEIYGLIYNIHVDDDPLVRRLVLAEQLNAAAIEDQRANRLLPIEMSVVTLGWRRNGVINHGLPPRPPLNLDEVHVVRDREELVAFTDDLSYLRLILRQEGGNVPVDQLLVAHIRSATALRGDDATWALGVSQEVIELLRSNYDVLLPTLDALSDALPTLPVANP